MNTMKKNGGFTLVELIIVIAILAILSTGAIAGYSAYIKSANNAAVEAVLSDISTSAVLANAQAGGIESIVITDADTTDKKLNVTITVTTSVAEDFETYFMSSLQAINASEDVEEETANAKTYVCTVDMPSSWASSGFASLSEVKWQGNAWTKPAK